jgi:hypothetical protein
MIVKIPYSMLIIGRLVGEVFEAGSFGSFHTNTPGFYTSRLERHRDGRIQKMLSLFTGYGTSPSRLPCLQGFPVPLPLYHKRVTLYTMQRFSTPQIISPERISRHLCIFSPIHPRVVFSKYDQATQSFTQRLVASSLADVNQPCCSSLGSALVSERSPLFLFELW